jgi:hypothetical protein
MKQLLSVLIISAAALMLGIVTPAVAQDNTAISGSASQSASGAVSGSMASGNDNAQNITFNSPAEVSTRASGTTTLRNVPAITAPALTTTLTETCMGSSTIGGAGAGFGLSIGSTWKDEECIRRLHAREISALGEKDVAKQVLCGSPMVAEAYAAVGRPCLVKPSPNEGVGGVVGVPRSDHYGG